MFNLGCDCDENSPNPDELCPANQKCKQCKCLQEGRISLRFERFFLKLHKLIFMFLSFKIILISMFTFDMYSKVNSLGGCVITVVAFKSSTFVNWFHVPPEMTRVTKCLATQLTGNFPWSCSSECCGSWWVFMIFQDMSPETLLKFEYSLIITFRTSSLCELS